MKGNINQKKKKDPEMKQTLEPKAKDIKQLIKYNCIHKTIEAIVTML